MKNIIILLFTALFLATACKRNEIETPKFDVTTTKTTYKVGDTVLFNFSGNPDFITFFSGENGKKYANVNRTNVSGVARMQFTSARTGAQTGSLLLMVSNNFAGVVTGNEVATVSNIASATWTDITSRAVLSTGASVASGAVDLSDFAAVGKPVFIAFKYIAMSGSRQNSWTISNLTVTNILPDATVYTLANLTATAITNYGTTNLTSPGWVGYKVSNNYNWVIGTTMVITGATTDALATAPAEAWAITGSIDLTKVTPDLGTFVKSPDVRRANYTNIYLTPGSYIATFVGANSRLHDTKETVKSIQLTITP